MWVTEIAPVWASSLLVPILVVWLSVYQEPNQPNQSIPAKDAAKRAASTFFSSTVMLAFGAFTISSALTKKQLSDRFAPFCKFYLPGFDFLTSLSSDWPTLFCVALEQDPSSLLSPSCYSVRIYDPNATYFRHSYRSVPSSKACFCPCGSPTLHLLSFASPLFDLC
jgi:hypothetical protein